MSAAAISDLDWEVKLEALEFWRVIIDESLRQQGMLDGSFPEITFSKEKQKIVRSVSAQKKDIYRLMTSISSNVFMISDWILRKSAQDYKVLYQNWAPTVASMFCFNSWMTMMLLFVKNQFNSFIIYGAYWPKTNH